jgi:hypothetical protein
MFWQYYSLLISAPPNSLHTESYSVISCRSIRIFPKVCTETTHNIKLSPPKWSHRHPSLLYLSHLIKICSLNCFSGHWCEGWIFTLHKKHRKQRPWDFSVQHDQPHSTLLSKWMSSLTSYNMMETGEGVEHVGSRVWPAPQLPPKWFGPTWSYYCDSLRTWSFPANSVGNMDCDSLVALLPWELHNSNPPISSKMLQLHRVTSKCILASLMHELTSSAPSTALPLLHWLTSSTACVPGKYG